MNIYKYKISDTQYLQIIPKCLHDDSCPTCTMVDFDYIDEAANISIRFGYSFIDSFSCKFTEGNYIQDLINGTKKIDVTISMDLGIECNQLFAEKQQATIFMRYYFLGNDHKKIRPYYNSWLYNDKDGKIIFEITPFYPWHGETKKTCPEKISYKKWIKDYKPTLKIIIPKKNIKKWINQAKELEKMITHEPFSSGE